MAKADSALEALSVCIEAEDENHNVFAWMEKMPCNLPFSELRRLWADAHEVAWEAVALEDVAGRRLLVDESPLQKLSPKGKELRLVAVPVDPAVASDSKVCEEYCKRTAQDASKKARAARSRSRGDARPTPAEPASAAKKQAKTGRSRSRGDARPQVNAAEAGKPDAEGQTAYVRYPAYDGSSAPQAEEAIAYEQENPKQVGTAGWERYEKYKSARTPTEALALGAAKGDLKHDWKKGFYKRV
eukprot:TRINITY_DN26869_c0_g1_i4.p1 TRINITY_DN26869_c0_g1~~TRINITY_DN26869_c0_g1_i4.p1  ORF type:complete len:243 (+),score=46.82 TRINITY_DN26869_c0_g1_i4:239-967(+)